jgi:hypothetical protein
MPILPAIGQEITLQVDLATTAMALIAFIFSMWLGWRQSRLDVEELRQQRDTDIIHWGNSCLDICCQAEMLLRPEYQLVSQEDQFERKRFKVLGKISTGIDAGRLYFPNSEADKLGLHKEGAFRGVRHPVLDMLVQVYDLLRKVTYKSPEDPQERLAIREQSIACKREFISRVQAEVDPRRRAHFLTKAI